MKEDKKLDRDDFEYRKLMVLNHLILRNKVDEVQRMVKELVDAGESLYHIDLEYNPLQNAASALARNKYDTRILKILIDNGADVNAGRGSEMDSWAFIGCSEILGYVWDHVFPCYEAAKIIIDSPTFKIEDLKSKGNLRIKQYEKIKAKMLFEEKVLADLEVLKAACTEINPESIMPSFIPKTQVDAMLAYYSQGYKAKVTKEMQEINAELAYWLHGDRTKVDEEMQVEDIKFFDDLAGQVVESLNQYTKYGWHQLIVVAKEFVLVASSDEGEDQVYTLSKNLMGLIGEEVTGNFFEPGIDG